MPGENISLAKSSLAFAKLAATPTDKAWSQAYNAGNLFACLSLTSMDGAQLHELQALGKELFSNLEAEFFTLEEKNLTTIAEAIEKSIKHIPEAIAVDFCLGYFKDEALYLFILGGGRVVMKRGHKIGVLLEKTSDSDAKLQTASGLLENDDTVILETSTFAKNVSNTHLNESLQLSLPSDIAESLSMHMHEKEDGDQAAIIVVYHSQKVAEEPVVFEEEPETEDPFVAKARERLPLSHPRPRINMPSFPKLPSLSFLSRLNHRKKLFLSVSFILLILLLTSIFLTKQNQEEAKNLALFQSIYDPALKSYDEGKGLENLNPTLSQEDFQKAEQILTAGKDKLPQGSKEDTQIEELLAKVQQELADSADSAQIEEVTLDENSLLMIAKTQKTATALSQNADSVFYVTGQKVVSVDKASGKEKTLVTNDDDWEKAQAIAPFQANFYLLDQNHGVLKYVPSAGDYSQSSYLKGDVDLSKAIGMAIDSAVWIINSDGSLDKYLRGEKQAFTIKELDQPFGTAAKIATDADTDKLYILDPANGRVIVLGKDGAFEKQYSSSLLKSAKNFEVLEKDKQINVLSGDKTYQLTIE